jgi:hypothetical protein
MKRRPRGLWIKYKGRKNTCIPPGGKAQIIEPHFLIMVSGILVRLKEDGIP